MDQNKVFLFSGEQSGDVLGSHLVAILKKNHFACTGVGGQKMAEAGLDVLIPLEEFQMMGFKQVFCNLFKILRQFRQVLSLIIQSQSSIVIFIDYPGFSLRMAKLLRKKGYKGKIIQYVCPSIWAWKKSRKGILEKYFDALFCLFAFEKDLFANSQLPTFFCGHLLGHQKQSEPRGKEILIFPGSREAVVRKNLPTQLEAAKKLSEILRLPIKISCARPHLQKTIQSLTTQNWPLVDGSYDKSNAALAIATCGTIVLELGLLKIPTAVTYKISYFDMLIAKHLFKIRLPFYSLVNILLGKEIFPEFIGPQIDSDEIVKKILSINEKKTLLNELKNKVYNKDHDTIFLEGLKSIER